MSMPTNETKPAAHTANQRTNEINGMLDVLGALAGPQGSPPIVSELDRIERFLRIRHWTRDVNPLREVEYTSPDGEWRVQVGKEGYWSLGKFTDSDVPNDAYKGGMEARGRFESVAEGDTLAELEETMVSEGAIPWACPNCGEEGGTPATSYSRELYGTDADGNRGEMREYTEECCSRCIRSGR